MEHFQYGKQIGKTLDIQNRQKRAQAQQTIFLGLESEKSENQIRFLKKENMKIILNVLMEILCRMDHTLFQTSSWGSELKQKRFGVKFRNTVKCCHNLDVALTFKIKNN